MCAFCLFITWIQGIRHYKSKMKINIRVKIDVRVKIKYVMEKVGVPQIVINKWVSSAQSEVCEVKNQN